MARHLQQRGRSPNEETREIFDKGYFENEANLLQDRLDQSEQDKEDMKKAQQALKDSHEQEIRNIQVDNEQKLKAMKEDHAREIKDLNDRHEEKIKATHDRHEEERKKWQGEMDDLKSSKAHQQKENYDNEEIAEEVAQQVKDNFSKDVIFESFRRLSPEKALVVYGEVCILLGHDCLWQTNGPKILDEIHERQKAKDKQHEEEFEELKKVLAKPTMEVKGDYVEKKEVKNYNKDSNVFNDKVISPQILPSDEDEEKLLA